MKSPLRLVILCAAFAAGLDLAAADVGLRIRFGLNDKSNTTWDGTVAVSSGRVTRISGWRFEQQDKADGVKGWQASTRPITRQRQRSGKGKRNAPIAENGVILALTGVSEDSVVNIATGPGDFEFSLSEVPHGNVVERLDGGVEIERTAATLPLANTPEDDDFPAAAVGPDGAIHVAHVSFTPGMDRDQRARTSYTKEPEDYSFLAKPTGGDRVWLKSFKNGQWSQPLPVTPGGEDVFKCAVTVGGDGRVWVAWSAREEERFDVFARSIKDGAFDERMRVSQGGHNDHTPVAATDGKGRVWIAWQGARGGVFRIFARRQTNSGDWAGASPVSNQSRNCWSPAIAADPKNGGIAIAWDTYEKGDYDVWLREFDRNGQPKKPRPVANLHQFESRPSLAYDKQGALWVAWERSGKNWGKDWGALDYGENMGLYWNRQVGLRVLKDDTWWTPKASFGPALPGPNNQRGVFSRMLFDPEVFKAVRAPNAHAPRPNAQPMNNHARVAADKDGRIWMIARTRRPDVRSPLGSVWINHAIYLDGDKWVGPILIPHSDNVLNNAPAVVAAPGGGLLIAHSSDHRVDRMQTWRANRLGPNAMALALLNSGKDPFINDIYVSRLAATSTTAATGAKLVVAKQKPNPDIQPLPKTVEERKTLKRFSAFRSTINGRELEILKGEFHRHTELSGDGGNDSSLEDMWRYAIDVAAMDWMGSGDHDNGGHREYPWWITQKTTDAYHLPGVFESMFTYERSVSYPEGHRNVVFDKRGIRTLPRLPKSSAEEFKPAPDTLMLYKYLKHFDGICSSHTSATRMGTDWRNHDAEVEPIVEIYQGARQNYERPGAPRAPSDEDALGGFFPKGFINLALKKGYRLGFQSSSDHSSTHISYCMVYAEGRTRAAILEAMKKRHTYAATDTILAEVRARVGDRDYMMGDEFTTAENPAFHVKLIGTKPFAEIVIIKDDEVVHTTKSDGEEAEFAWADPRPEAGKTSYYYVRSKQTDDELVWASPMWIKYAPKE